MEDEWGYLWEGENHKEWATFAPPHTKTYVWDIKILVLEYDADARLCQWLLDTDIAWVVDAKKEKWEKIFKENWLLAAAVFEHKGDVMNLVAQLEDDYDTWLFYQVSRPNKKKCVKMQREMRFWK